MTYISKAMQDSTDAQLGIAVSKDSNSPSDEATERFQKPELRYYKDLFTTSDHAHTRRTKGTGHERVS